MDFEQLINEQLIPKIKDYLLDENGDIVLKGFVDSKGNLFPLTLDTKVFSKVLEFVIMPAVEEFCRENNFTLEEPETQNSYPDLTLIDNKTGDRYAIDIKSTYRENSKKFAYLGDKYELKKGANKAYLFTESGDLIKEYKIVKHAINHDDLDKKVNEINTKLVTSDGINGMTLGAFKGYFRDRTSSKNILYPYSSYKKHFVLGFLYTRDELIKIERDNINNYKTIDTPFSNMTIFFTEKYKIAVDTKGSGNTANIGSVKTEKELLEGNGKFSSVEEFDDYWMNYDTSKYTSYENYKKYKKERD